MSPPHSSLRKWLGRALIASGLFLLVGVGCILAPLVKWQDPSFNPDLSLKGYWEAKQPALKSGLLLYHDAKMVRLWGDKAWAEKMVTWVQAGKKPFRHHGSLPEEGLPTLTNHDIAKGEDPRVAWPLWWQQNSHLSQEQWLQAGFKKYGVEVSLPPQPEDWPKLLTLLREAGTPVYRDASEKAANQIPHPVEYNAYRWLRDAGFSPELYLADRAPSLITADEKKGLLGYSSFEKTVRDSWQAPVPGRLAFADPEWWGMLALDGGAHVPFLFSPIRRRILALVGFGLLIGGWLMCRGKRAPRTDTVPRKSWLVRSLGVLMMSGSLLLLAAFAWWVVVVKAASLDTHRSPAGYWSDAQRALRLNHWGLGSTFLLGQYGDKKWAENIMVKLDSGTEVGEYFHGDYSSDLEDMTNHEVDYSQDIHQAWQDWWAKNRGLTQEQWIQAGFKEHGFDIAMPPTEKDWPTLLYIMGRSAGPGHRPGSAVSLFYPRHLTFNAYRCLRDSGFDSVRYAVEHPLVSLSVEESGGLFSYREFFQGDQHLSAPLPGRLAFASDKQWSYWDKGWMPRNLKYIAMLFTALTLGLGGWGWRLQRQRVPSGEASRGESGHSCPLPKIKR